MDVVSRRALIGAAGGLLFASRATQAQVAGVALVIGNSKYQWETPLPNVRRDAPDIAKRFQELGLKTELVQDADSKAMEQAIGKFKAAAEGAPFAAFYFAGHGVASKKENYLVPLDADLSSASFTNKLVHQKTVLAALKGAANRLMVMDACRNNPAEGSAQLETERAAAMRPDILAAQNANRPNTVMLFSTSPGRIALDGPAGENSPFAAALLRQLDGPSIDLYTLPPRLRRELLIATDGRQVSWDLNSYTQSYTLKAPRAARSTRPPLAYDPASLVELPKAYEFARANGLYLPDGLVARRSAASIREGDKVGSFSYTARGFSKKIEPQLLIVLSVDESRVAQAIVAGKNDGAYWRFITAQMSKNTLEFVPMAQSTRFVLEWSGRDTGTLTQVVPTNNATIHREHFKRLDG
jgi:hypothetical protein